MTKNLKKKQNDEFSHEKSKTGRFIYGPLFLPGALGGAFYPIYGTWIHFSKGFGGSKGPEFEKTTPGGPWAAPTP